MPTDTFIQSLTSSGSGVAMLLLLLFIFAASAGVTLVALLERADRRRQSRQHREECNDADL